MNENEIVTLHVGLIDDHKSIENTNISGILGDNGKIDASGCFLIDLDLIIIERNGLLIGKAKIIKIFRDKIKGLLNLFIHGTSAIAINGDDTLFLKVGNVSSYINMNDFSLTDDNFINRMRENLSMLGFTCKLNFSANCFEGYGHGYLIRICYNRFYIEKMG